MLMLRTMTAAAVAFTCVVGCGTEAPSPGASAPTIRGDCYVSVVTFVGTDAGSWACTTSGVSGDQAGRSLPQCPAGVQAGDSCRQTVASGSNECFACSDGGTGIDWGCSDYGWLSLGTYSCP
jgi:hypothetical protein